ncbi:MAG: hypothetical protein Q4A01_02675 [Coriobacteriales bacterium]|nr:hypothetical protein [Coriobacteriales bacterium]
MRTDIIDAFATDGSLKYSIDVSGMGGGAKGAKEFARRWRHGLIARATDPTAPIPTSDELAAIAAREYKDELRFCRRYMDGISPVYPEGNATYHGYSKSDVVYQFEHALHKLCSHAWPAVTQRRERDDQERDERRAVEDADRYLKGLHEVEQLDARSRLKAAIEGMGDKRARRAAMEKYPELFTESGKHDLGEAEREQTRNADMATWLASHPEANE